MAWTDQAENIAAIERYIGQQEPPPTPAAVTVRDEFLRFAAALGDYERNFEQQAYDRARNFRLAYNRANAVTVREKEAVEEQAIRGVSTEQIEGKGDRRTSTGAYIPPPSESSKLVMAAAGVGLALVAAVVLLKR